MQLKKANGEKRIKDNKETEKINGSRKMISRETIIKAFLR
jgi:hypothetical protein